MQTSQAQPWDLRRLRGLSQIYLRIYPPGCNRITGSAGRTAGRRVREASPCFCGLDHLPGKERLAPLPAPRDRHTCSSAGPGPYRHRAARSRLGDILPGTGHSAGRTRASLTENGSPVSPLATPSALADQRSLLSLSRPVRGPGGGIRGGRDLRPCDLGLGFPGCSEDKCALGGSQPGPTL